MTRSNKKIFIMLLVAVCGGSLFAQEITPDNYLDYMPAPRSIISQSIASENLHFGQEKISENTAQLFGRPAYDLDSTQHKAAVAGLTRSGRTEALSDRESSERQRAEFSDLIGTEEEIKEINRLLNGSGWQSTQNLGKAALEEVVKSADSPRVLHIATHGFFILRNRPG